MLAEEDRTAGRLRVGRRIVSFCPTRMIRPPIL